MTSQNVNPGALLVNAADCHGLDIRVVFMCGGITYGGHISKPGITELKVGSSENWYSRVANFFSPKSSDRVII